MLRLASFFFAAAWLSASAPAAAALTVTPIATATAPVYLTHAGDKRLFVVEQAGLIRIFDRNTGAFVGTPFLDIQSKVLSGGERGLLSVAFHPDYASNGYFYVYYSNLSGSITVERYHTSANPNVADAASAATMLVIAKPFDNHNGGQLQIGKNDGYLYIGTGDGDGDGDVSCLAQNRSSLLGKILRLDIRKNLNQAPFYGIPVDNPFTVTNDPAGQTPDEIWALGLRNPWRFSFDRANGDMYIGDVGQDGYEEVDFHSANNAGGQNYGWKVMEGAHCFDSGSCATGTPVCGSPQITLPVYEYDHSQGNCSIIGGYVYRGQGIAELAGRYVYTDFCSGDVSVLAQVSGSWQSQLVFNLGGVGAKSFGEDSDGGLYVIKNDTISRFGSTTPAPALGPFGSVLLGFGLLGGATAAFASRRRRLLRLTLAETNRAHIS